MPDGYPLQNPRVAWRVYDGEAVLVCPDDSTLHALNAAGTLIWSSADGATPTAAMLARLCATFDVDRTTAAVDAREFIEALRARGLLTVAPADRSPDRWTATAGDTAPDALLRRPYEPPAVVSEEIFETTALACGKIGGQGGRCNTRPKRS